MIATIITGLVCFYAGGAFEEAQRRRRLNALFDTPTARARATAYDRAEARCACGSYESARHLKTDDLWGPMQGVAVHTQGNTDAAA